MLDQWLSAPPCVAPGQPASQTKRQTSQPACLSKTCKISKISKIRRGLWPLAFRPRPENQSFPIPRGVDLSPPLPLPGAAGFFRVGDSPAPFLGASGSDSKSVPKDFSFSVCFCSHFASRNSSKIQSKMSLKILPRFVSFWDSLFPQNLAPSGYLFALKTHPKISFVLPGFL